MQASHTLRLTSVHEDSMVMDEILQYYGIFFFLTVIFLNLIQWTGTFGYVILSEDHCAFLELQGVPSLWEPDCMEICILYIIKDLLVLKSGTVIFSLKQ